jgi:type IV pilus biogenesis protein CpaD/CtpE
MVRIVLLLAALAPLVGCASPRQMTFSCMPEDGHRTGADWRVPPTKDAGGYYTCNSSQG